MAKVEDCPGFETFGADVRAGREAQGCPPEAQMRFVDYMEKWLDSVRPSIAAATYQSYSIMMKARVIPYFTASAVLLGNLTPQHIEEFYQTILNDGCTTNTVIHYHAIIRKALQSAVKKTSSPRTPLIK